MTGKTSPAQRMYDTLKRIARDYAKPGQFHTDRNGVCCGLSPDEAIEMAYENVQAEAEAAIKGLRRPT